MRIYIMASINITGNDGPLTVTNLALNKVDRASVAVETMIAGGMSNSAILAKMGKYQAETPAGAVDIASTVKTAAAVTKPVKAKAKVVAAPKAKRAKGANNTKRTRALEMFKDMTAQGLSQEKMLKAVQDELKITYANTYYYYSRVFKKA